MALNLFHAFIQAGSVRRAGLFWDSSCSDGAPSVWPICMAYASSSDDPNNIARKSTDLPPPDFLLDFEGNLVRYWCGGWGKWAGGTCRHMDSWIPRSKLLVIISPTCVFVCQHMWTMAARELMDTGLIMVFIFKHDKKIKETNVRSFKTRFCSCYCVNICILSVSVYR